MKKQSHQVEIEGGQRFAFGQNWINFLRTFDNTRLQEAICSLKQMLEVESLQGKRFVDVGSGSGLFSLAARKLGAFVLSFDYDPQSVACTQELKRRFFPDDPEWIVEEGSVLDDKYIALLGQFDVVYSWGVLHHTGEMWKALHNVTSLVRDGGVCEIAIYNTSSYSKRWLLIKQTYCTLPHWIKTCFAGGIIVPIELSKFWSALIRFKTKTYFDNIRHYKSNRGMNWWHDQIDWLGGLPYETAKPEEIFEVFKKYGFKLTRLTTCGGGTGCNQFIFLKEVTKTCNI